MSRNGLDPRDMFGEIYRDWSSAGSFQAIQLSGDRGVAKGADVDLDRVLVPSLIQPSSGFSTQGDVDPLHVDVP